MAGEFSHSFVDDNGTPITKPFDEIDNDGDNYVECDAFDPVSWAPPVVLSVYWVAMIAMTMMRWCSMEPQNTVTVSSMTVMLDL